jgi:methionine-gamma-lyase
MENTEAAQTFSSGMGAISSALLQACEAGDEIVASRCIYGGTYALLAHLLPRFGIRTHFVDTDDEEAVRAAIGERTAVVYCETLANPLLQVADIPRLASLAHSVDAKLVVDSTFTPLLIRAADFGADVVVHSLTKYVNGMGDALGGVVCGRAEFIESMLDLNSGVATCLGAAMDATRAAAIHKNLLTLDVRLRRHSETALALAKALEDRGHRVSYPGLASHRHHRRARRLLDEELGFGGVLTIEMESREQAEDALHRLQVRGLATIAVSLGCVRTLASMPATSTSSELPHDEQLAMGMRPGLIRLSVGLEPELVEGMVKAFDESPIGAALEESRT